MNIVKNCIKCKKKKFNILIEWPQIKSRAFILHSSVEISVSWWLGIKPWFPAISHKFYERRLLRNRQVFRGILWSIAVMWQKISQNSLMSCQRRVYLPPREVGLSRLFLQEMNVLRSCLRTLYPVLAWQDIEIAGILTLLLVFASF